VPQATSLDLDHPGHVNPDVMVAKVNADNCRLTLADIATARTKAGKL